MPSIWGKLIGVLLFTEKVIYDNIYHDNFTYALGRNFEYCEDVFGNEYPRTFDFGLYRIPWDVMFKKGTDVHKFFQPLF